LNSRGAAQYWNWTFVSILLQNGGKLTGELEWHSKFSLARESEDAGDDFESAVLERNQSISTLFPVARFRQDDFVFARAIHQALWTTATT